MFSSSVQMPSEQQCRAAFEFRGRAWVRGQDLRGGTRSDIKENWPHKVAATERLGLRGLAGG